MFTDSHVDSVAQRLTTGRKTTEEVREYLLSLGLTEYQAFLCYKAAKLLLHVGFYTRGESIEV
jgi:hypothetical protein